GSAGTTSTSDRRPACRRSGPPQGVRPPRRRAAAFRACLLGPAAPTLSVDETPTNRTFLYVSGSRGAFAGASPGRSVHGTYPPGVQRRVSTEIDSPGCPASFEIPSRRPWRRPAPPRIARTRLGEDDLRPARSLAARQRAPSPDCPRRKRL